MDSRAVHPWGSLLIFVVNKITLSHPKSPWIEPESPAHWLVSACIQPCQVTLFAAPTANAESPLSSCDSIAGL